jgi:hypothetical protein
LWLGATGGKFGTSDLNNAAFETNPGNMRTVTRWLLLMAIIAFICPSCQKSSHVKLTPPDESNHVQLFTISAKSGGAIKLSRGEAAVFPPNVFVNAVNQPVSGVVNIQLQEIYSDAGMILSDSAKTADRVVAGNEFYIRATATQNGLPLHILQGTTYHAAMPFDTIFGE